MKLQNELQKYIILTNLSNLGQVTKLYICFSYVLKGNMASILGSSDEKTNGHKLMRLIVDGGGEALRNAFKKIHPGNLQVVLSCTCSATTSCNQHILSNLRSRRKIINDDQWDKLYPRSRNPPNINDFDITLLSILLRNICGLSPPSLGWDKMPNVTDHSIEADIVRIKLFRNERFGHIPNTSVSAADFNVFWAEIKSPLLRLGISQSEIDRLENEQCGEEEVQRVLNEWRRGETEIMTALVENLNVSKESLNISKERRDVVKEINDGVKALVQKDEESRSDDILNKHLLSCNFQREIELYYEKFTRGTREWVINEFSDWFDDETSKNRAFIISGHAGMGKSVIAAVICKRFSKHVAASHFFQYNNSQYNNPNILLQSLALQLSQVVPAYKEALIKKLSGKLGQSLTSMNIEGLFSVLFKEPFSSIADSGKRILIVLDAVDESDNDGRHELANLISNHLHKLPSNIRFLITTRPERNLIDRFRQLNPLFIEGNDERNLSDLKLVLQQRISGANSLAADFLDSLAERCDGLMLYAFFLSEIYNNDPSAFCIDSLPKGIEEHYERYFRRLKCELGQDISEDTFFSLLSALAVAKEPLPEAFLESLCGFENSTRKMQKVRKAISSLLVVNEDKSISFFHKSLRDWLVDKSEHDYSVDVRDGHKNIFELCVKKLDEMKKRGVRDVAKTSAAIKYSLKYLLLHMLDGLKDTGMLEYFVSNYVVDLEVMFASVCVNVDLTLNNLSNLTNHEAYNSVSRNTRATVDRLFFIIKRFVFLLGDYPQTFLQNIVNEGGGELSLKASSLLQTRYKDIIYLEFFEKDRKNDALEFRCLLSGTISGIDISPNHDYVVCCYEEGGIELFSLETGKSEWKIHDFKVDLPALPPLPNYIRRPLMLRHCIVFHPRENLIFPGRFDKAISLQGTFTEGPFHADEGCSKFTNCCFSSDNSKMVTNYGNSLNIWNVLSGNKERHLQCKTLFSFSFTASGNFLGTVDIENVFNVYDMTNDYRVGSKKIFDSQRPVEIVATFEENSWCCSIQDFIVILNHDFTFLSCYRPSLADIILPSNPYCQNLACFVQHPEQSWFSKLRIILNDTFSWYWVTALRYFLIRDQSVLIYSCSSNAMHVFSIKGLIDSQEKPYNVKRVFTSFSRNGDFVYLNNTVSERFTICNLESNERHSEEWQSSRPLHIQVVRDGVILYNVNRSPELWNSDLTQRVARFDELVGVKECLSVSDELIACVYQSDVIFFNVFTKEIENKTHFNETVTSVLACSIKYHVLAEIEYRYVSLWRDGKRVDIWEDFFKTNTSLMCRIVISADFSLEGNRLALSTLQINKIFIFDTVSMKFLSQVTIYGAYRDGLQLKFFDSENLVCTTTNHIMYLINVERGEILTCVDFRDNPAPIDVCGKRSIIFVGHDWSESFELVHVWLPRK